MIPEEPFPEDVINAKILNCSALCVQIPVTFGYLPLPILLRNVMIGTTQWRRVLANVDHRFRKMILAFTSYELQLPEGVKLFQIRLNGKENDESRMYMLSFAYELHGPPPFFFSCLERIFGTKVGCG